jgi:hypothetical protein
MKELEIKQVDKCQFVDYFVVITRVMNALYIAVDARYHDVIAARSAGAETQQLGGIQCMIETPLKGNSLSRMLTDSVLQGIMRRVAWSGAHISLDEIEGVLTITYSMFETDGGASLAAVVELLNSGMNVTNYDELRSWYHSHIGVFAPDVLANLHYERRSDWYPSVLCSEAESTSNEEFDN